MEQSRIELDGGSRPTIRPHEQPKDIRNSPPNQKKTAQLRVLLAEAFKRVCVTDFYGEYTLTFSVSDGKIKEITDGVKQSFI